MGAAADGPDGWRGANAGTPRTARCTVEVVDDLKRFQALSAEWSRLHDETPGATPFQSHAWLASWWEHYGSPGGLRVVLVRRDGRPVAAGPFYLRRVAGVNTLRAMGGAISDVSDVLAIGSGNSRRLVEALLDLGGWDVVDLPEVRPGTAAGGLTPLWPGPVHRIPASLMLEFRAQPIEELVAAIGGSAARAYRRRLRRTDALDLEVRAVGPEQSADALRRLLDLHARQWDGRRMTAEHGRSRFLGHLVTAVPRMIAEGRAVVLEYRVDAEPLIVSLHLVGQEFLGGYLDGVAPEARTALDVSAATLREELRLTMAVGRPIYSMLRGEEPYKYRLDPRVVRNERVLMVRPGNLRGELLARAARQRAAALHEVKRRSPWLRNIRDRLAAAGGR